MPACENAGDEAAYKLRDTGPAGGIILYINPNAETDGWTYLEAAPANLSSEYVWSDDSGTTISVNRETFIDTAIGTGKQNTANILKRNPCPDTAADACVLYELNGYSDWFLPSKDELTKMYQNLVAGTDENNNTYTPVGNFLPNMY